MKKHYTIAVLIVIYGITLGVRVYWLAQKDGFMVDEVLSIALACYNDYMWYSNYELNKRYTGKEVKEISLCDNDSIKNVLGDIYRLWKDNRDPPHTNFYYSLLRLSLAGLKTGNIKPIIFRGGILNIILFTVSFCFFYALLRLLFQGKTVLHAAALFCAFISTAALSNTLLLRPYQLQETLFVVFCYFFVKSLNWKKWTLYDKRLYIDVKTFLLLSFMAALTLLTGYYAIIFIGLLGLYVMYANYKAKNIREIMVYIVILICGIILDQMFYSRFITGFISSRATETASTLFGNFWENIKMSFLAVVRLLNVHYFTWPVIAVCLISLFSVKTGKNKITVKEYPAFIFIAAMVYSFIVLYFAPYKTLRYIMPVFPFFTFLPLMIIDSIKNKKLSLGISALLSICFLVYAFNISFIENIYKNKPAEYKFAQDEKTPVFVLNTANWKYAELVPYLNDKQDYYFIGGLEDLVSESYSVLYLVTEADVDIETKNIVLGNFEIEGEYTVSCFICRKLYLKNL